MMKMTMARLQTLRAALNWAVMLVVVIYLFALRNMGLAGAAIALVALAAILAGAVYLARAVAQRLYDVAMVQLDPDLLREEMALSASHVFKSKRAEQNRSYYEKLRMVLSGDFDGAIEICLKTLVLAPIHAEVKNCDLLHLYSRTGQLDEAHKYAGAVEQLHSQDRPQIRVACDRALGVYALESDDFAAARTYLSSALSLAESNYARLILHYDLARLEQTEGNREAAIDQFRQAADIGPKTWMGQQASEKLVEIPLPDQLQ